MVLGPVHDRRGRPSPDHRLAAARHDRAAQRAAAGAGHHRRGGRPARRGRGLRGQAARGGRPRHRRTLPGHHPRLRDAQRPARDARRADRHRPGLSHPAQGAAHRLRPGGAARARATGPSLCRRDGCPGRAGRISWGPCPTAHRP
ncbi:hypothetical protein SGPA1_21568 [Streptomyces misionensis JCM 4497]